MFITKKQKETRVHLRPLAAFNNYTVIQKNGCDLINYIYNKRVVRNHLVFIRSNELYKITDKITLNINVCYWT